MKVLTVTLNAAIDQLVTANRLGLGAVNRANSVRHYAGGKGINVARCLADFGVPVVATGLLGRDNAVIFEDLFVAKRIVDRFVRVPGATRTNITIVAAGVTTEINFPGVVATPASLAALDAETHKADDIVLLSGSLPTGCPPDYFARLVSQLHAKGSRAIVDTSGPALAAVLAGDVMPFCIKPNASELAEWAGRRLDSRRDIFRVAADLRLRGIALVVVSLGDEGALFLSEKCALVGRLAAPLVVNTVGAGDALLAGIISALTTNSSLERLARLATAFAVSKLGCAVPGLPSPATVESFADLVVIEPQEYSV